MSHLRNKRSLGGAAQARTWRKRRSQVNVKTTVKTLGRVLLIARHRETFKALQERLKGGV